MREEDQRLDQPPAMRRCRRCSNEGGTKSCEGRCCGSEGCSIDVRDMLRGQGVKTVCGGLVVPAAQTGVSGRQW
eukprot:3913248-Prymnesium_polylepis.1